MYINRVHKDRIKPKELTTDDCSLENIYSHINGEIVINTMDNNHRVSIHMSKAEAENLLTQLEDSLEDLENRREGLRSKGRKSIIYNPSNPPKDNRKVVRPHAY